MLDLSADIGLTEMAETEASAADFFPEPGIEFATMESFTLIVWLYLGIRGHEEQSPTPGLTEGEC